VKDSHPGYPWCKLGKDNGAVMTGYGNLIWDEVAKRFNKMLELGDKLFELAPEELVKLGIFDTVKVFIKKEPHSLKKINNGKLRIIASVSLVDQIVTRLLCMRQNKAEIKLWESCPSAPGMGLTDDGFRIIWETAERFSKAGTVCETDVSGWDWSMQQWELDLDASVRADLMGVKEDSLISFFLKAHAHCVGHSVFALPDGELLAQTIPGGQLSGDYNTSSTNSRGRIFASMAARWRAGYRSWTGQMLAQQFPRLGIKAMGDDSFEIWFRELVQYLEEIGHSIKMCVQRPNLENFEFCSQVFVESGVAYPVDYSKTLFRFLSHNPADPRYPEYRAQLLYYFRHLPESKLAGIKRLADARVERAHTLAGGA
jgi:hypothetical protein